MIATFLHGMFLVLQVSGCQLDDAGPQPFFQGVLSFANPMCQLVETNKAVLVLHISKGQEISEEIFLGLISVLASKMGLIKNIPYYANYVVFNMINAFIYFYLTHFSCLGRKEKDRNHWLFGRIEAKKNC